MVNEAGPQPERGENTTDGTVRTTAAANDQADAGEPQRPGNEGRGAHGGVIVGEDIEEFFAGEG